MIDNILLLNRIYTPAIPKEPVSFKKLSERLEIIDVIQQVDSKTVRPIRYWSQDGSRFGLKTITRRVLTALGIKPVGPVQ